MFFICSKARSRLHCIVVFKRSGLSPQDLVAMFCSIVRQILEYASSVWHGLYEIL